MIVDRHAASTFWAAAPMARDISLDPRRRRRSIQLLIVLGQRSDIIGEQARAVLRVIKPASTE
jgi:hypothetical protein